MRPSIPLVQPQHHNLDFWGINWDYRETSIQHYSLGTPPVSSPLASAAPVEHDNDALPVLLKTTRMGASTKTQGEPKPQSPEEPVAIRVPEVCCPCGAGSSQSPRHTALCWAPPAAGWVLATTLPFFLGFWAGMGQGGCCPMSVLSTELCLSGSFPWQTKNPPEKSMYREQLGRHGSRTGGVN